jgi:predicted anti-sigma-YlaC factor YlaD
MKLMLDCKDVSRQLSSALDSPLDPAQQARLRLHLVICQTCRNVDEQMDFIRRAMRRLGREEPLPPPPEAPPQPAGPPSGKAG